MIKTGLITIFSVLALIGHSQSSFGIQIEMGVNSLTGISSDTIVPYGLSGAEYSISKDFYASPSLRFRKNIAERFSLETGIGYLPVRNRIHLQFYDDFFSRNVDTNLDIRLHYLSVPVACNYSLPLTTSSSLFLMASVNTYVLISQKDNYEDIIWREIGWIKRDWYTRIIIVPSLSAGYRADIRGMGMAELGLFASRDVNPFVNDEGWGFYKNLLTARNFRYGLQLKYFLNH
jgi:outer membrane protein with beta-barrel domain